MDIKYLTQLNDNPTVTSPNSSFVKRLQPLSIDQINTLEITYNSGNPFPAVLTELLYIAGGGSYLLETGVNETQDDLQHWVRDIILGDNDQQISRPFFAIDMYGGHKFLFVYLDEQKDDPEVYQASPYRETGDESTWIIDLEITLSNLINQRLLFVLSGYNPY
jgi:hypothetical protein